MDVGEAPPDLVRGGRGRERRAFQDLDLEELAGPERLLEPGQERIGDAVGAQVRDGLEPVGEGPQVGPLPRGQRGDGSSPPSLRSDQSRTRWYSFFPTYSAAPHLSARMG
jgi:hypothetical protein